MSANFRSYGKRFTYRARSTLIAYASLLKLRSASLNSLTAAIGVLLAAGSDIPWGTVFVVVISVWLVAAGCGAINCYLDRDIDKLMLRTSKRPLPLGRIKPAEKSLYLGVLLTSIGLTIAALWLNLLSVAAIAAGAIIYVLVYTLWLKRKTPWSVVVGGLAGSSALLAGWFSVTASFGLAPLLFGALIFLWTLPHYWGLAIATTDQSKRAGIPTLPVIYGERMASRYTAISAMILVPFSVLPYVLGIVGQAYLFISLIIGAIVLRANIKLYFAPTAQTAWATFKISSPYLAIIYIAVAIDILLI